MNIYEDYFNYMNENMDIIDVLQNNNCPILLIISDVYHVTDYIYKQNLQNSKISDELEEIFSLGYGYLSNVLSDIKTYYNDSFNKDIVLFNKYNSLLISMIILQDFKDFLDVQDNIDEQKIKKVDNMLYKIDGLIANLKTYDETLLDEIDSLMEDCLPSDLEFHPVYTVFAMIREELDIMEKD